MIKYLPHPGRTSQRSQGHGMPLWACSSTKISLGFRCAEIACDHDTIILRGKITLITVFLIIRWSLTNVISFNSPPGLRGEREASPSLFLGDLR